ncbi:Mur ligase [Armillaria luteobubalina]|uniref:Folylpolyglutamate synthase n=1 Tax=Armillaria luteobubalina TaxID=153913 RepID=A0AA39Q9B4_9AGAR|nr:Mur ligase [Armillaria luteobubalina]
MLGTGHSFPSLFRSVSLSYRYIRFRSHLMSTHTYKEAIECLNSLQSNAVVLEAVRASGGRSSAFAIPEMLEYLHRIGYSPDDLNALNVIHITGTKGKGSTSAFTSNILQHAKPRWKIGLYTSPHLVAVRERIRVNGEPISEEQFTKYFFEIWEKLEKNDTRKHESTPAKPGYFRYLTLLAFHAFLDMKVDATVLEVGVGGTYDSTNIVPKPVVTGITALGIDHVTVLGKTLKEIAWQKGGIFKEGISAFTMEQPQEGMEVLRERASELKASSFTITPLLPGISDAKLGLAGDHQIQNANLAVYLAQTFLQADVSMSDYVIEGLKKTSWPGRCQTVADPSSQNLTWFLDGAHTLESLDCCMQWHVSPGVGLPEKSTSARPKRILVFNCTSGRSGSSFLSAMYAKLSAQLQLHQSLETPGRYFDEVIFCTNVTYADGGFKGDLTAVSIPEADLAELKTQHQLAAAWRDIAPSYPQESIHVLPSVEHALDLVRTVTSQSTNGVSVLVAGSLHLVGGMIEVANLATVAL